MGPKKNVAGSMTTSHKGKQEKVPSIESETLDWEKPADRFVM